MKKMFFIMGLFLISCMPAVPNQKYKIVCTNGTESYCNKTVYWDRGKHGSFYHLIEADSGYKIFVPTDNVTLIEKE